MNSALVDAYRLICLTPAPEMLNRRAAVLTRLSEKITRSQCLDLLRLYLGDKQGGTYASTFRQAFRETDANFPEDGNDFEMRTLAALALAEVLTKRHSGGIAAALAIVAVFGAGWVNPPSQVLPALLPVAYATLAVEATEERKAGTMPELSEGQKEIKDAVAKAQLLHLNIVSGSDPGATTKLTTVLRELTSEWDDFSALIDEYIESSDNKNSIIREEAEMLWWLHELKSTVSSRNRAGTALIVGRSLDEKTLYFSPPLWARALLHEVLLGDQRSPITTRRTVAVAETPHEWRQNWVSKMKERGILDLCPVANETALSLPSVTNAGSPIWFRKMRDDLVSLPDIAFQVYTECLLWHVAGK